MQILDSTEKNYFTFIFILTFKIADLKCDQTESWDILLNAFSKVRKITRKMSV